MDPDQTAPKVVVCRNDFYNHKQMTKQTTIVVIGAFCDFLHSFFVLYAKPLLKR